MDKYRVEVMDHAKTKWTSIVLKSWITLKQNGQATVLKSITLKELRQQPTVVSKQQTEQTENIDCCE